MLLKGRKYSYVCFIFCLLLLMAMSGQVLADDTGDAPVGLDVVVVEDKPGDGNAKVGYKVDGVENLGPLGSRKVLDTPYSTFSVSSDLIENTMVGTVEQAFKMNPLVSNSLNLSNGNHMSSAYMRGFSVTSTFIDGIRANSSGMGMFVEDKEKVEIYSGLSGFLFGAGNVGGVINYVTKRPTPYYLNKVTIGYRDGTSLYAHADVGGPIMGGKFGYRFNAMFQDGDTEIKNQSLRKQLISGAFDWNATDNLKFQVNATYNKYELDGRQIMWNFINGNAIRYWHKPIDGSKLYSPEDTYHDVESHNLGANVKWRINDHFNLRAAYIRKQDTRDLFFTSNQEQMHPATNQYSFTLATLDNSWVTDALNAYFDAEFETFAIKHKVTFGGDLNDNTSKQMLFRRRDGALFVGVLRGYGSADPRYTFDMWTQPYGTPGVKDLYASKLGRVKTATSFNTNLMIADEITFNEQWTLLAGLNRANIQTKNYDGVTGARTSEYDESALTPSVSLMFKPVPKVTTYATYMEALEQGSVVGTAYTNAGEITSPVRSKQYEVGAKTEFGGMLLTLALFQIERTTGVGVLNANGSSTWKDDGLQVNRGLEFTFSGKATDNLTLLGGATYIDAEHKKLTAANRVREGKDIPGLAKITARLYSEYDLPFVNGLTLTGGVYYVDSSYVDWNNTTKFGSYALGDLGLRYTTRILGPETTFRAMVANVTDKRYWLGQSPDSVQIGRGRTFYLSATVGF